MWIIREIRHLRQIYPEDDGSPRLNRSQVTINLIRLRSDVIASLLGLIESKGRFRDPRSVKSTMSPLQFDL